MEKSSFIIYEEKSVKNKPIFTKKDQLHYVEKMSDGIMSIECINYINDKIRGPHEYKNNISINIYNKEELTKFSNNNGFSFMWHENIIDTLYNEDNMEMFELFSKDVSFNACFYNQTRKSLLIINGKENLDMELFFGYSKVNGIIMFSNNFELLNSLCNGVKLFDYNSYFINGEFKKMKDKTKTLKLK